MRSLMESVVLRRLEGSVDSDAFRVPQPVNITQGDVEGKAVIVSWVTQEAPRSNTVLYWRENSSKKLQAHGKSRTYSAFMRIMDGTGTRMAMP
uniref:Purple acid phosphatase 10 n=1 Tax=Noccaea caerulescens TaxID=107243 RepID=A0A1J3FXL0_NOCCA